MSEGAGEARPEAEGELALARIALDDGDLRHAAAHAGNAIASDPTLRGAYETLDQLTARADDALGLFPVPDMPYIGAVAARSYVLARFRAVDEAFALLCEIAKTEPSKPWAAGWLATSEASVTAFADDMDPGQAANALFRLAGFPARSHQPGAGGRAQPFPGDSATRCRL